MKVDLPQSGGSLEPFLDLAMAGLLLDADGQEVRGDMLVDFETKRLPDS
jgi:hypothetical protein